MKICPHCNGVGGWDYENYDPVTQQYVIVDSQACQTCQGNGKIADDVWAWEVLTDMAMEEKPDEIPF